MLMYPIDNVNVQKLTKLEFSPNSLKMEIPLGLSARNLIHRSRKDIFDILARRDRRLLVLTGPCSVHDEIAAADYARRLKELADQVKDHMLLVMRVYPEKPRSKKGWKGIVNDPFLNDTCDMNAGIRVTRRIMRAVLSEGVPIVSEIIDPMLPPFFAEMFSVAIIGARSVMAQTQRQLSSGVSGAVGLKNCPDGSFADTLDALESTVSANVYLSIGQDGQAGFIKTAGNPNYFLIMRGGKKPNYDMVSIDEAVEALQTRNFRANIVVDCSHGNSFKKQENQKYVWENVISQRLRGNDDIIGLMLESNINPGRQARNGNSRAYGVSITDECIGWEETEKLIVSAHRSLSKNRQKAVGVR